ncbi:unnamed protein product, partial [Polarella glacialis]
WRKRLYEQAKPMQIQLLQEYGAKFRCSSLQGPLAAGGEPSPAAADSGTADRVMGDEPAASAADEAAAEPTLGASCSSSSRSPGDRSPTDSAQEPPRCVCGSRLACTSVRERVMSFIAEETPVPLSNSLLERLMLRPPIMCDLCSQQVSPAGNVWTCENGRRTVLHSVAYDVCEACFAYHAHGIEIPELSSSELGDSMELDEDSDRDELDPEDFDSEDEAQ